MPLSEHELLQVLEMFQKSGWQGMQLQSGTRRLVVSKNGRMPNDGAPRTETATPASACPSQAAPAPAVATPRSVDSVDPGWIAVKAPMLGTFYAAPKPGAPPFVKLGQSVSADDTVGILEVMKLMNYLKAGVAGTIARIAIANGDLAEFDQVLFYIEPQS